MHLINTTLFVTCSAAASVRILEQVPFAPIVKLLLADEGQADVLTRVCDTIIQLCQSFENETVCSTVIPVGNSVGAFFPEAPSIADSAGACVLTCGAVGHPLGCPAPTVHQLGGIAPAPQQCHI